MNFIITKDTIIDPILIDKLFDKEKFMIKLTPIHETFNAIDNGFKITTEYNSFNAYRFIEQMFKEIGWDVKIFLDTKEEDDDSMTCGTLMLTNI